MFCSQCGTKNSENSAYCYNCGRKMATCSDLPRPANKETVNAHAKAKPQAQKQFVSENIHGHEWGLVCTATIEGVAAGIFASHLHPNVKDTSLYGGVNFKEDPYLLQESRDQKYTTTQIWENTQKWLRILMGGAATDELLYGITFENNNALLEDVAKSENLLRQHHINIEDSKILIQVAFNKAKQNFIDHPDLLKAIRANSAVREEGLSPEFHASEGRLANFQEIVRKIINEQ